MVKKEINPYYFGPEVKYYNVQRLQFWLVASKKGLQKSYPDTFLRP